MLDFYRGKTTTLHTLYTDAKAFFDEATYPTRGMRQVLYEVFGRLAGTNTLPAIHRLETGFGGGKTHTLIACAHLAYRGRDLAGHVAPLLDTGEHPISAQLGAPRGVTVVGIAGDRVPVVQSRGDALVPYPLWAELARQVGGDKLLAKAGAEALSPAAPGEAYFDKVLGGRKALRGRGQDHQAVGSALRQGCRTVTDRGRTRRGGAAILLARFVAGSG